MHFAIDYLTLSTRLDRYSISRILVCVFTERDCAVNKNYIINNNPCEMMDEKTMKANRMGCKALYPTSLDLSISKGYIAQR